MIRLKWWTPRDLRRVPIILLVLTLLWNLFTWLMVAVAVAQIAQTVPLLRSGDIRWVEFLVQSGMLVVIVPMVVVAIGAIIVTGSMVGMMLGWQPEVAVDRKDGLRGGDTIRWAVRPGRRLARARQIRLALIGREVVKTRVGTNTTTDFLPFHEDVLWQADQMSKLHQNGRMRLPDPALPSGPQMDRKHGPRSEGRIEWVLKIDYRPRSWPKPLPLLEQTYELEVVDPDA